MDRRVSTPLIELTASSIFCVTSDSTSCGAAPGRTVVTVTIGKSTFGKRSTPSCRRPAMPMTQTRRMRTVAKTGRLTLSFASHCIVHLLGEKAVAEVVGGAGYDFFVGAEAGEDDDVVGNLLSCLNDSLFQTPGAD